MVSPERCQSQRKRVPKVEAGPLAAVMVPSKKAFAFLQESRSLALVELFILSNTSSGAYSKKACRRLGPTRFAISLLLLFLFLGVSRCDPQQAERLD